MDVEIQAQHTEVHPRWRDLMERRIGKLNDLGAEFLRLHITLVHSTHHVRGQEEVRILAALPGDILRVNKTRASMGDAIHAAFTALEREFKSRQAQMRSPSHEYGPRFSGVVSQLFTADGYGFIRTAEAQEVYFHRDAVHDVAFEALREGVPVEFAIEQGEKGPQAARVVAIARTTH